MDELVVCPRATRNVHTHRAAFAVALEAFGIIYFKRVWLAYHAFEGFHDFVDHPAVED